MPLNNWLNRKKLHSLRDGITTVYALSDEEMLNVSIGSGSDYTKCGPTLKVVSAYLI